MTRIILAIATIAIATLISGCATTSGQHTQQDGYGHQAAPKPRTAQEKLFPYGTDPARITEVSRGDPGMVLILVEGEAMSNIVPLDQAGRPTGEVIGELGDPDAIFYQGQTRIRGYYKRFTPGPWMLRVVPFYYYRPPFGKEVLAPLPEQKHGFTVPTRPEDMRFDRLSGRYWGAVVRIRTGHIPPRHWTAPRMNISCTGFACTVLDGLGLRASATKLP